MKSLISDNYKTIKEGNIMGDNKPEQISIGEELHVCPECGYKDV